MRLTIGPTVYRAVGSRTDKLQVLKPVAGNSAQIPVASPPACLGKVSTITFTSNLCPGVPIKRWHEN